MPTSVSFASRPVRVPMTLVASVSAPSMQASCPVSVRATMSVRTTRFRPHSPGMNLPGPGLHEASTMAASAVAVTPARRWGVRGMRDLLSVGWMRKVRHGAPTGWGILSRLCRWQRWRRGRGRCRSATRTAPWPTGSRPCPTLCVRSRRRGGARGEPCTGRAGYGSDRPDRRGSRRGPGAVAPPQRRVR